MVMISPSSYNRQQSSQQQQPKRSSSMTTKITWATIVFAIVAAVLVPGTISLAWAILKGLLTATPWHRPEFWSHLWINLGGYALLGVLAGWVIGWIRRRTVGVPKDKSGDDGRVYGRVEQVDCAYSNNKSEQ